MNSCVLDLIGLFEVTWQVFDLLAQFVSPDKDGLDVTEQLIRILCTLGGAGFFGWLASISNGNLGYVFGGIMGFFLVSFGIIILQIPWWIMIVVNCIFFMIVLSMD